MDQHRISPDGVQARALNKEEHALLNSARAGMWRVRAPVFRDSPDDRVFFVAMDGTGNNQYKDPPENHTVVAKIRNTLLALEHPAIATTYIEGVGTQEEFLARSLDGAKALTLDARAEKAYLDLCLQVREWREENPNARIHVLGSGFSRGGESYAILTRMIHERGIRDPTGVQPTFDKDGVLTSISWPDLPLLDPPGSIPTAGFIIDPVGTGRYDTERRLPASNVGLVQLTSWLEPRDHFSSTQHAPFGLSDQGRVANFRIPGAHSDLGGSYHVDGAGRVVYNMQVDYFRTVLGGLELEKVPEATDPRMYVAHSSEQHLYGLWPDHEYRAAGERIVHQKLGPSCQQVAAPDICLREPIDWRLADGLVFKHVEPTRHPGGVDAKMETAQVALDAMYKRDTGFFDSLVTRTRIPLRAEALQKVEDFEFDPALRRTAAGPLAGPPSGSLADVLRRASGDMSERVAEKIKGFDVEAAFQKLATAALHNDTAGLQAATRLYASTPLGMAMQTGAAVTRLASYIAKRDAPEEATEAVLPHERNTPLPPQPRPGVQMPGMGP